MHRDEYQRKEIWLTDNISGITGVLLNQGLVDRVMPIGYKTWGNKFFVLRLLTLKLRAFLTKQVSQDLMNSFSGLIAPRNRSPPPPTELHPTLALFQA